MNCVHLSNLYILAQKHISWAFPPEAEHNYSLASKTTVDLLLGVEIVRG